MTKGIDISKWQGQPDFARVKESSHADFIIMRCGINRSKDVQFDRNYSQCKKYGIPVGCYFYSMAMSVADAVAEAECCIRLLQGKQFEYPIYLDIEEAKQLRLGRTLVSKIVRAFLQKVESAGYFVGLYSNRSTLNGLIDDDIKSRYTIWVADLNMPAVYKGAWDMHQYSWVGRIKGINGNVDMDECRRDFPSEIKNAGLNGFPKPEIYEVNTAPEENVPYPEMLEEKPIEIKVPDTPKPLYSVTITCTALNIRTGAGMAYAKTGEYARCGDVYGVYAERTTNGTKWGKISATEDKWISISNRYVQKV